jgi:hypothetical protein
MRAVRLAVVLCVLVVTMISGESVRGQQAGDPPPAPVPTPIFSAKTAFISNASGKMVLPSGTPDLTYNEFYAGMKTWGRYTLVSNPADADLIFEIRFVGVTLNSFQFRVAVTDAKTHVLLWAFSEDIPQSANQKKSRQYFDGAMGTLLSDLQKLAAQPPGVAGK